MIVLCIILGLITVCAICIARAQAKIIKDAEAALEELNASLSGVAKRAEALQAAQAQTTQVREAANEERQELAATAESELAARANALFGVRDKQDRSNGGPSGGN
jgi:hypothetical protein